MPRVRGVIAPCKPLGIEQETAALRTGDQLRVGAAQLDHRDEADPRRRRNDHLVALVEEARHQVGLGGLAAGRGHYFGGLVVELVVALELEADRFLELARAGDRRVLGLARGERAARGFLDAFGSVEVGLAGGQRNDVDAGGPQFGRAGVGRQRGRRLDRGYSAVELEHLQVPDVVIPVWRRCPALPADGAARPRKPSRRERLSRF